MAYEFHIALSPHCFRCDNFGLMRNARRTAEVDEEEEEEEWDFFFLLYIVS